MRIFFFLLAIVFLSACSTSSLESQEPIYKGHTNKSTDEFNKCLSPRWIALKPSSTSIQTETGYQISSSDDWMGAVSLVKIDRASDGGSDVKVYVMTKGWNDPWGTTARSCM